MKTILQDGQGIGNIIAVVDREHAFSIVDDQHRAWTPHDKGCLVEYETMGMAASSLAASLLFDICV